MNPAGCDQCGRQAARPIHNAHGDEAMKYPRPMPRVVPCSTLARWWLALRRFWLG